MLFFLALLLTASLTLSCLRAIPQSPLPLAAHISLLLAVCWLGNLAFSRAFHAKSNPESVLISALILALIISPSGQLSWAGLELPLLAGLWAMASKYLFGRRLLFNPAAFGVFCAGLLTKSAASWWVGNYWLFGLVLVGGFFSAAQDALL